MSTPELSVVCKSCGAEVSPYVTECPYCGTRLRKRAPKLERRGDELTAKETRRTRRERKRREAASERADRAFAAVGRPYFTYVAILVPAVCAILVAAGVVTIFDLGAMTNAGVGDPTAEPWRYLAAPWVGSNIGYLFATGVALAIFCPGLERRLGTIPTALLLIACGALGMLAAQAFSQAFNTSLFAYGANGVALGTVATWVVLRRAELSVSADSETDWIGVAVIAAVLLLIPIFEGWADPVAGVAGALVGALAGLAASRFSANPE